MFQEFSSEAVERKSDRIVVIELRSYKDHNFSLLFYLFYIYISIVYQKNLTFLLIPGSIRILYKNPAILLTLKNAYFSVCIL